MVKYWQNRAIQASNRTDGAKGQRTKELRRIVCGWLFTEAGYLDKGAGYPKDSVIRAIKELEDIDPKK